MNDLSCINHEGYGTVQILKLLQKKFFTFYFLLCFHVDILISFSIFKKQKQFKWLCIF